MILVKSLLIYIMILFTFIMLGIAALSHETPKEMQKAEDRLVVVLSVVFLVLYVFAMQI